MGHEIVYCSKCQVQLRGPDFEKGAAFHAGTLTYCLKCAPDEVKAAAREPSKRSSTVRIPVVESGPRRASTSRIPVVAPPPPAAERPSSAPVGMIAGVVLGIVALVLMVYAATSGSRTPTEPRPSSGPREGVVPGPATSAPRPPTPGSAPVPAGVDSLRKARDYVRSNPADFAGQVELYERALEDLRGTPGLETARDELESVRKAARGRVATELGTLDAASRTLREDEQFDAALEKLEDARRRLNFPDWTAAINKRVEEIQRQTTDLFAAAKAEALQARSRGAEADVQKIRERVARWGMQKFIQDFAAALAPKPTPPPDPKPAPPSAEALALAGVREAAFGLALARDYAAAATELKKGADALKDPALLKAAAEDGESLKQAAQILKDVLQSPTKWAKGQKLSLDVVTMAGTVEKVDGTLLRMDPFRAEVERSGADPAVILLGEIRVGSLAKLYKPARGALSPAELRPLVLLCLLEGDPEAARDLGEGSDVPERYWAWAKDHVPAGANSRELEARSLLFAAEKSYEDFGATADSARKHQALLKDYPDTLVVRRNRAFIASRSQGGRDYLFFPEDMAAGGTCVRVKNPKTESCFSSNADSDGAKTQENFVELTFSVLPDLEYRCWVYVGACCAETFAFSVQATELSGLVSKDAKDPVACEPGTAFYLPVKNSLLSLKKTHAGHPGPKAPSRWEWIPIPLPKYASAGPKKLRLLTNQAGFSVAYASVSAVRQSPPLQSEIKTLEAARAQTPGARTLVRAAPAPVEKPAVPDQTAIFALSLEGGKKPAALETGTVEKAPDRPAGRYCAAAIPLPSGISQIFVGFGPEGMAFEGNEVLSFEYWVDAEVAAISFNFLDRSLGKTLEGAIAKPVVGKWTKMSFKMADLGDAPRLRPGDIAGNVYLQAVGGTTRKFFIDNLQITRPRASK